VLAAILANVNRDPDKRSNPYEPGDFFPSLAPPPKPKRKQTPAQLKEAMVRIAEAVNKTHNE
jgi:hypothetical protein